MTDLPENIVFVIRKRLSDGSFVFDVRVPEMQLPAVTEQDAGDFAEGIKDLIERHTNSDCGVVYE